MVRGISDTHHPNIRRSYHGQTKTQFEEKLEMDDIIYCISYSKLAFILAIVTVNMLTLVAMCFMTRRQCVRDGFLSWHVCTKLWSSNIKLHMTHETRYPDLDQLIGERKNCKVKAMNEEGHNQRHNNISDGMLWLSMKWRYLMKWEIVIDSWWILWLRVITMCQHSATTLSPEYSQYYG